MKVSIISRFFRYLSEILRVNCLNRLQFLKTQLIAILIPAIIGAIGVFLIKIIQEKFGVNFDDGSTKQIVLASFYISLSLFYLIVSIPISIARLHDCNYSGWWIFLLFLLSHLLYFPYFLLFFWPGTIGTALCCIGITVFNMKAMVVMIISTLTIATLAYRYIPWCKYKLNLLMNEIKLDIEIARSVLSAIIRALLSMGNFFLGGSLYILWFALIIFIGCIILKGLASLSISFLLAIIIIILIFRR